MHLDGLGGHSEAELAEQLSGPLGADLGRRVASNLADFDVLVRRDEATVQELAALLGGRRPTLVGHLHEEVHDLLGLAGIAEQLGV